MKTIKNINETTAFAKGETFSAMVEDYNEALRLANEISENIEIQYKKENPCVHTFILPFIKRENGYCVEVRMVYSDMYAKDDIRVQLYFRRNWFAAGRKAVMERNEHRKQNEELFSMFGF